jgi:hypothetical protein
LTWILHLERQSGDQKNVAIPSLPKGKEYFSMRYKIAILPQGKLLIL